MVLDKEQALEYLSKTPIAFIATLADAVNTLTQISMPPIHHYKLIFENIRLLRGSIFSTMFVYHQCGASSYVHKIIKNSDGTTTTMNKLCEEKVKVPTPSSIYLACISDEIDVNTLIELDNNTVEELLQSAKMPLGWNKQSNGKFKSPWQYSHAKKVKWHENQRFDNIDKCTMTGRPLLVTGETILFSCEAVQKANTEEYQHSDEDGTFQLTVTNNSSQSVEVPALLRDPRSGKILWEESVFVITSAGNHFFPNHGQAHEVESTLLESHESVSTKLNTLTLRDLQWPQDGWRITLIFCLGDKATEGNYYFFTDHHDSLRVEPERKLLAIID